MGVSHSFTAAAIAQQRKSLFLDDSPNFVDYLPRCAAIQPWCYTVQEWLDRCEAIEFADGDETCKQARDRINKKLQP